MIGFKQTSINNSMAAQKYCLALDLTEDQQLVAEYKAYHQKVWPEVIESIKASGIEEVSFQFQFES